MLYEPFARKEFNGHQLKHYDDNFNYSLISRFEDLLYFLSMITFLSEASYELRVKIFGT